MSKYGSTSEETPFYHWSARQEASHKRKVGFAGKELAEAVATSARIERVDTALEDIDARLDKLEQEPGIEIHRIIKDGTDVTILADVDFRMLLDLWMFQDPWPLSTLSKNNMTDMLQCEAERRGFDTMLRAYHDFKKDKDPS